MRNNQIQGTFQEQLEGSGPPSIWICGMWTKPWFRVAGYPDARRQGHVRRLGGMHRTDFQHKLLEVEIAN
ncbi:MAG: hypothetical protein ACLSAH_17960 [Bilophila wadsworthia]